MHQIQMKQFNHAIKTLDLLKVEYGVKHPVTGEKLGKLELAKVFKKRKIFDFGGVNFKDPLKTMDVGDVVEFKFMDEVPINNLQSRVCSEAYKLFGASNYTTHVCREAETVQILRTA